MRRLRMTIGAGLAGIWLLSAPGLAHQAPAAGLDAPEGRLAKRKPRKSKAEIEAEKKAAEEAAEKAAAAQEQQKAEAEAAARAEAERAAAEQAAAAAAAEQKAAQAAADAAREKQLAAANAAQEARGLDARTRRLSDALALSLKRLPGDHRDQRFAVLPFDDVSDEAKQRQLGLVVSDLVVTNLVRDHNLPLVERARLSAVIGEIALGQTGAIEAGQAVEYGGVLGVRALVTGQIADAGNNFKVTTRVLDVESGAVLLAEETDLPKEELIAVSTEAVVLKSKAGAFFRSAVAPGWGQVYNAEPVKAGLVIGAVGALAAVTLVSAGVATYFTGAYLFWDRESQPDKDTLTFAQQKQRLDGLRTTANAAWGVGAVFAGLTGIAWGSGALEAYLSGTDVESLDAALIRE